jgi:hypothetical protein
MTKRVTYVVIGSVVLVLKIIVYAIYRRTCMTKKPQQEEIDQLKVESKSTVIPASSASVAPVESDTNATS